MKYKLIDFRPGEVESLIMRWGALWNLVEKHCKTLNEEWEEREPTLSNDLTSADKVKDGIPLDSNEMLDIVLHIDKSFEEYVNEVNVGVYKLFFKDELSAWYSLSYRCNKKKHLPDFEFKGQQKRIEKEGLIILN